MAEITTARSGNVLVPYVDAKKRTKELNLASYLTSTGWTCSNLVGRFESDSTGKWRFTFNGKMVKDSGTASSNIVLSFADIVFAFDEDINALSYVSGVGAYRAPIAKVNGSLSSADIIIGDEYDRILLSGCVILESEPTVYTIPANMEDVTAVDMFIAENSLPGSKLLDASIPTSKLIGMYEPRNFLINGALDFWQRGVGPLAINGSAYYLADRYEFYHGGSSSRYLIRSSVASVSGMPKEAKYACKIYNTIADTPTATHFWQKIEGYNAESLQEKTVTFSAWVKADKAYTVCFTLSNVNDWSYLQDIQIGTSWKKIEITVPVNTSPNDTASGTGYAVGLMLFPNAGSLGVAGENLSYKEGISGTGYTFGQGGSDYIETTGWMLNIGSVAAPFSRAGGTIGGELVLCQRFFEKNTDVNDAVGAGTQVQPFYLTGLPSTTRLTVHTQTFMVDKRSIPTIDKIGLWESSGVGGFGVTTNSKVGTASGAETPNTLYSSTTKAFNFRVDDSGASTSQTLYYNWAVDAEL